MHRSLYASIILAQCNTPYGERLIFSKMASFLVNIQFENLSLGTVKLYNKSLQTPASIFGVRKTLRVVFRTLCGSVTSPWDAKHI